MGLHLIADSGDFVAHFVRRNSAKQPPHLSGLKIRDCCHDNSLRWLTKSLGSTAPSGDVQAFSVYNYDVVELGAEDRLGPVRQHFFGIRIGGHSV